MRFTIAIIMTLIPLLSYSQSFIERYESFQQNVVKEYSSFRDECNRKYIQFLIDGWKWYKGESPLPIPKENPIPPRPYQGRGDREPVLLSPKPVPLPQPAPQPAPIEPVRENPVADDRYLSFDFYGTTCKVRFSKGLKVGLNDLEPKSISKGWEALCTDEMNNTIRDCLEARIRYGLSDWAYLLFLNEMGKACSTRADEATLLMAFLYCQSGYQMRLAVDKSGLKMLFGSEHRIYNHPYFVIDGVMFYPFGDVSDSLSVCNAAFEGETPLSLLINSEQTFGGGLSGLRNIVSERYPDVAVDSQVPVGLVDFYDTYPTSIIGNNLMTRWAMYANVPLARESREAVYPKLREAIRNLSEEEAADKLLNWVQTGFVYEYDDTVWGEDRAFFAEETLYYPYCDCEDRSILFSRLVRDLLHLDVALVYYPGHLATAVAFDGYVEGDAMMIDGHRFVVCDPTYIGAPVGMQMPDLEYDKAEAIVLKK